MSSFANVFEYMLLGWATGLFFHLALYFVFITVNFKWMEFWDGSKP